MSWILIVVGMLLIGVVVYLLMYGYEKDSNDPEIRKLEISAKYATGMTRFAARKETVVAQARVNLLKLLNEEQAELDHNTEREADLAVQEGSRQVEFERQQTTIEKLRAERIELETRNQLMTLALASSMDITTFLQISLHRELKQIDLEARATEYQQDQENIDRVEQTKLALIDRATHRLFSMYEQRKKIEASDDAAKDDKLSQLNYNIKTAEDLIRGEQDRFIQATLGEEERRSLSADDSGAGDSEEAEASQEQASA